MKTKKDYELYLNKLCPDYESEQWILGGKNRNRMYPNYGKTIRKHDPILFDIGYQEFCLR